MDKQILLPTAKMRELKETFKVSRSDLLRALKYERNSNRAKMLRAAALERGGLIFMGKHAPANFCPKVETEHTANNMMYQSFGDRVVLQISKDTNEAKIIIDDEPVATFKDMTLNMWGDVLYSLQQIYNKLTI